MKLFSRQEKWHVTLSTTKALLIIFWSKCPAARCSTLSLTISRRAHTNVLSHLPSQYRSEAPATVMTSNRVRSPNPWFRFSTLHTAPQAAYHRRRSSPRAGEFFLPAHRFRVFFLPPLHHQTHPTAAHSLTTTTTTTISLALLILQNPHPLPPNNQPPPPHSPLQRLLNSPPPTPPPPPIHPHPEHPLLHNPLPLAPLHPRLPHDHPQRKRPHRLPRDDQPQRRYVRESRRQQRLHFPPALRRTDSSHDDSDVEPGAQRAQLVCESSVGVGRRGGRSGVLRADGRGAARVGGGAQRPEEGGRAVEEDGVEGPAGRRVGAGSEEGGEGAQGGEEGGVGLRAEEMDVGEGGGEEGVRGDGGGLRAVVAAAARYVVVGDAGEARDGEAVVGVEDDDGAGFAVEGDAVVVAREDGEGGDEVEEVGFALAGAEGCELDDGAFLWGTVLGWLRGRLLEWLDGVLLEEMQQAVQRSDAETRRIQFRMGRCSHGAEDLSELAIEYSL